MVELGIEMAQDLLVMKEDSGQESEKLNNHNKENIAMS